MKKVFKFMAFAAIASLTFVACNNNNKPAEEVIDTTEIEAIAEDMMDETAEAIDSATAVVEEVAETTVQTAKQTAKQTVKKAAKKEVKDVKKEENATTTPAPAPVPEKVTTSTTVKRPR